MKDYRFSVFLVFFALILTTGKGQAQELLTLEDAVKIALERNFDIKLVSNEARISANNVSRANAGFYPSVGASAVTNNNIQTGKQSRVTGDTEFNNAKNSSLNYGVDLNWTIFNGFRMFARYEQLQELQKLGESNIQATIITRVADVINNYFNLVQQQQQLKANLTAIEISRLRLRTSQSRFTIGKAARLEVLNAQVDLNTDTTTYLRQQETYTNTQIEMNELLARDLSLRFRVADSLLIDQNMVLADLSNKATSQNPSLQAAQINRRIAELDLKQVRASRYPTIGLNSGYNFSRSTSAVGFATQSTGRGLNYGLSASIPIFNGFLQRTNEQNASIGIESAQLEIERLNLNINSQLASAFQSYQTSLSLVKLEESNQRLAKQNLDITLEKYRLGTLTPVEFREAQLNYVNARVRFTNAQYQAKLAEIALKEIAGDLKF